VALMRSRTVEDSIVQRYGLAAEYHAHYLSDARKDLEKNTTIDGDGKDGLIRISIEDRDPRRAAELANGYVDQFRNLSEHLAITEASQRRVFFEGQLEQAKDKLGTAEEKLKKTEQQTGLIQLDSQTRALIESAASLRAQIAAKEVQIQSLQTFATAQNAQLVQAQQELQGLKAQLAKLGGSGTDSDATLMMPRGKVTEAGLEYVRELRDIKYYETIFDILARQYEMARLDEAKEGALIQIVDAAIPPDRRSSPKRTLIVLGATAFGLMLAVAIALLQATFDGMKKDLATSKKLSLLRKKLSFRNVST
jgi:tyrosine-protein kinase Etk/Wzc